MPLAAVFFVAFLHTSSSAQAFHEARQDNSSVYFEVHESRRLTASSGVSASTKVTSSVECGLACLRLPWCSSYNFQKTPDKNGQYICECLDMNRRSNSKDLNPSQEFDLYGVMRVDHHRGADGNSRKPTKPPGHVRGHNTCSTSILVQWDAVQPHDGAVVKGYRLKYQAVNTSEITLVTVYGSENRELTLTALDEFTKYNICVSAFTDGGDGPMSCNTVTTAEDRPSKPPNGVKGHNVSSTSILLQWGEVPQPDRNGIIRGYRVEYQAVNTSKETMKTVDGSENNELTLTGLNEFRKYNICVSAFTAKGDGPMSCSIVTTAQEPGRFNSCKEAYDAGEREDRAYELELASGKTEVYCHMSPIPGCGSGGFSLVMKINGSAKTFLYDSALWTNRTAYNVPEGSSINTSGETKLPTYWETRFTKLCLGMTVAGQTKHLSINYTADSLYSLIADGQYRNTSLGRDAWKSLVAGTSLQLKCNKEGFNAKGSESSFARARIGITSNEQNDCESNDSRIGFGTGGRKNPNDSCGNSAYWYPDNGDKRIRAFGFIYVN